MTVTGVSRPIGIMPITSTTSLPTQPFISSQPSSARSVSAFDRRSPHSRSTVSRCITCPSQCVTRSVSTSCWAGACCPGAGTAAAACGPCDRAGSGSAPLSSGWRTTRSSAVWRTASAARRLRTGWKTWDQETSRCIPADCEHSNTVKRCKKKTWCKQNIVTRFHRTSVSVAR